MLFIFKLINFLLLPSLKDNNLYPSIWKFVPSNQFRVLNVVPDNFHSVMQSGSLYKRNLDTNGTYYCLYEMNIIAQYSVTLTRYINHEEDRNLNADFVSPRLNSVEVKFSKKFLILI